MDVAEIGVEAIVGICCRRRRGGGLSAGTKGQVVDGRADTVGLLRVDRSGDLLPFAVWRVAPPDEHLRGGVGRKALVNRNPDGGGYGELGSMRLESIDRARLLKGGGLQLGLRDLDVDRCG